MDGQVSAGNVERLWTDDSTAAERLLAIDLSTYDDLVTYPAGHDWPLERKKIMFLQAALRLGYPWDELVYRTRSVFGETLRVPFIPDVTPTTIDPLTLLLPTFDVARQTPEQWGVEADKAWATDREEIVKQIHEQRKVLIENGTLKEFERRRQNSKKARKNADIAEERTAYEWAAHALFGKSWSAIATIYPVQTRTANPKAAAQQKRKRADQIRKRVLWVLRNVGLPGQGGRK